MLLDHTLRFLTGLALSLLTSVAHAQPFEVTANLAGLEALLNAYPTYADFRKHPDALENYFRLAQTYYGGDRQFPREPFDQILSQLDEQIVKNPEWATRVWAKRVVRPPLKVRSAAKNYNVKFRAGGIEKLQVLITGAADENQKSISDTKIKPLLLKLRSELDQAEVSTVGAGQRATRIQRAQLMVAIKSSSDFIYLKQVVMTRLLNERKSASVFSAGQCDVILDLIESWRGSPEDYLPRLRDFAHELRFLTGSLPKAMALAENDDVFETRTAFYVADDAEFEFIDVPRPFHSIFRGIWPQECVGGSCLYPGHLTPTRWAIPLLEGGFEQHVTRNQRYEGYLSTTRTLFEKKDYYALESLTRQMSNQIVVVEKSKQSIQAKEQRLFDWWLQQETARKPEEIEGFVAGQSNSVNNMGGLFAIRTSAGWMNGHPLGPATSFTADDPWLPNITGLTKPNVIASVYKNKNLINDLGVDKSGYAVLLQAGEFDYAKFEDVDFLKSHFAGTLDLEAKFWTGLWNVRAATAEANKVLYDEAWLILLANNKKDHAQHEAAQKLIAKCMSPCRQAIISAAFPNLSSTLAGLHTLILWSNTLDLGADGDRAKHIESAMKSFTGDAEQTKLLREILMAEERIQNLVLLAKLALPKIKTAHDYLEVTRPTSKYPSDHYIKTLDTFHLEHLDFVQSLKPNPQEWGELASRTKFVSTYFAVVGRAYQAAKTWSDLEPAIFIQGVDSPSEFWYKELDAFMAKNHDDIENRLQPNARSRLKLEVLRKRYRVFKNWQLAKNPITRARGFCEALLQPLYLKPGELPR